MSPFYPALLACLAGAGVSAALASLHSAAPQVLTRARLPAWLLGPDWPRVSDEPALAELVLANGRIQSLAPCQPGSAAQAPVPGTWDLDGALVLPGFVDAHVHLDKAFTLSRIRDVQPGLLGAIEASTRDLTGWTPADIAARATRGLEWAWQAGTVQLRTHVNWAEIGILPMAWPVLAGLAEAWADRVQQHYFPYLKGVEWECTWTGCIAFTPDHLMRLFEPAPGLVAVTGYNGRGD